jgi:hypothetical protein
VLTRRPYRFAQLSLSALVAAAGCRDVNAPPDGTNAVADAPSAVAAEFRKDDVAASEFFASAALPAALTAASPLARGPRLSLSGAAADAALLPAWEATRGTSLNFGDDYCNYVPLGFTFTFYGRAYDGVYVSSNGNVTLNYCNPRYEGDLPQNSPEPAALIAPATSDWIPIRGGVENVYYAVLGEQPRRRLVVTWSGVRLYRSRAEAASTFQLQLYEGTNRIQFGYERLSEVQSALRVGISSGRGPYVLTAEGASVLALAQPGAALCYTPAGDSDYAVTHAACGAPVVSRAPTAVIAGPEASAEGEATAWSASGSAASDGGALTYAWDFGDGTPASGEASPSHAFADDGTYAVTLTVTDAAGVTSSDTSHVAVSNVAPTASLVTSGSVNEGSPIAVTLAGAFDPSSADAAAGVEYAFDCGTGYGPFGPSATASCPTVDDETRAVRAAVRDKDGARTEYDARVNVVNVAPRVDALVDAVLASGETHAVRASFDDPGVRDAQWVYAVDWGTGLTPTSGRTGDQRAPVSSTGRYLRAGRYTVAVAVTDKDGGSGRAEAQVVVQRLEVGLDVRPQTIRLNEGGSGTLPVAVLSRPQVSAATIDAASARLGHTPVARRNNGTLMAASEDVNGDGRPDLVLHFERAALLSNGDLTRATTALALTADLADGRQVEGRDAVRVVP